MAIHPQPNRSINGLSLCSGVGGLELGLHIAEPRYRTVCYVEREAYPAATLVARMAEETLDNAPVWDDVGTFKGRAWRGQVHIITGGYPCQPFSIAGKQRGKNDPRHLWPHLRRIVKEVRPEWCFFENVDGHLAVGAADVFQDLRQLEYTVKAGLFSALETGASQIRRRLFIVAHANEIPLRHQHRNRTVTERPESAASFRRSGQPVRFGRGDPPVDPYMAVDALVRGDPKEQFSLPIFPPPPHHFADWATVLKRRPDLQPELFGLDDGLANRLERSDAAGNGVVSLAAAYAWRTLKAAHYLKTETEPRQ